MATTRDEWPRALLALSLLLAMGVRVATAAPAAASPANDPRFHGDLLGIARSYMSLQHADGSWWSPLDCFVPLHPSFLSRATGEGAHSRKIYTLFVKDIVAYAKINDSRLARLKEPRIPPPPEVAGFAQVVVKASYLPAETCAERPRPPASFVAPVVRAGKTYRACEERDLFVMYQPAKDVAGTDDGWVYGTVTPDGKTVTSAGRVESCMGCHQKAPRGRLFGLQPSTDSR